VKRVFINGYGSIGSRIASFLMDDPEIRIVGVGKQSADAKVGQAVEKGLNVYVPESQVEKFAGSQISGTIESALDDADIVIDASPGGCGYQNKVGLYEPRDIPAIYQGGESIVGPEAVSDILFNSRTNYDEAISARHVMQGSCNVTGMGRILAPLRAAYHNSIRRIDVTLVRRWADLEQTNKSVPDTIEMTESPHHGQDVKASLDGGEDAPLYVRAIKVPTRQMHLHIMDVRFSGEAPSQSDIHRMLSAEAGVAVLWTAKGTAQIRECARNMEFSFVDTNLVHVHANMTSSVGDTLQLMYSDDQTGIVIPENHMLLQAMTMGRPYEQAALHTESVFHMAQKKQILQETFARRD